MAQYTTAQEKNKECFLFNLMFHLGIFMVIHLMPHGKAFLQQGFAAFAVYADSLGVGWERCLPEDPAHVMEQPSNAEEDAGVAELGKTVQEELGVFVALFR